MPVRRLITTATLLAAGCGDNASATHDAILDGSREICTPFSVTAQVNATTPLQPVWAGDAWAMAGQGVYVRIDDAGTVIATPLPDLPGGESFGWDGVELGYYVQTPLPHIALFTPGDVSTLHASPSFGTDKASAQASVRGDPTGAPRIEAFFTDEPSGLPVAVHGWSDGTQRALGSITMALALAPMSTVDVYAKYTGGPGAGDRFALLAEGDIGVLGLEGEDALSSVPQFVQIAASDHIAVVRQWPQPPLAWNGDDAFVTFDGSAVLLYDRDFQASGTRPLDPPSMQLIGVGATHRRALLVFETAPTSYELRYVQICF